MATSTSTCTPPSSITLGDTADVELRFYNELGALADPATLLVRATHPPDAPVDITGTAVHTATGVYIIKHVPNKAGTWIYRADATPDAIVVETKVRVIRPWMAAP